MMSLSLRNLPLICIQQSALTTRTNPNKIYKISNYTQLQRNIIFFKPLECKYINMFRSNCQQQININACEHMNNGASGWERWKMCCWTNLDDCSYSVWLFWKSGQEKNTEASELHVRSGITPNNIGAWSTDIVSFRASVHDFLALSCLHQQDCL